MKISADPSTFEIVLFKSTTACIHIHISSLLLRACSERQWELFMWRRSEMETKSETGLTPPPRLHRAQAREIRAQLIKPPN